MFGEILHLVLETLYKPYAATKRLINKKEIDDILKQLEESSVLTDSFKKVYGESGTKGRNVLIEGVIKNLVKKVLEQDKAYSPFSIEALETEGSTKETDFSMELPVRSGNKTIGVKLKGKIDRVDLKDGLYRIIDYKTGNIERRFKSISEIFSDKPNKTIHQALFYSMLYEHKFPDRNYAVGIISTKDIYSDKATWKLQHAGSEIDQMKPELVQEYQEVLSGVIEEILNPELPFRQTEDAKTCGMCEYNSICGR
jgi:ATP-dependent helicase/DNAse subunit B